MRALDLLDLQQDLIDCKRTSKVLKELKVPPQGWAGRTKAVGDVAHWKECTVLV